LNGFHIQGRVSVRAGSHTHWQWWLGESMKKPPEVHRQSEGTSSSVSVKGAGITTFCAAVRRIEKVPMPSQTAASESIWHVAGMARNF
jgi:hypothetical protein